MGNSVNDLFVVSVSFAIVRSSLHEGEKRKVPVVESSTQQEQKAMTMREWLDYFGTNPADRQAVVRLPLLLLLFV